MYRLLVLIAACFISSLSFGQKLSLIDADGNTVNVKKGSQMTVVFNGTEITGKLTAINKANNTISIYYPAVMTGDPITEELKITDISAVRYKNLNKGVSNAVVGLGLTVATIGGVIILFRGVKNENEGQMIGGVALLSGAFVGGLLAKRRGNNADPAVTKTYRIAGIR